MFKIVCIVALISAVLGAPTPAPGPNPQLDISYSQPGVQLYSSSLPVYTGLSYPYNNINPIPNPYNNVQPGLAPTYYGNYYNTPLTYYL